jgi:hypothetical protein
MQWRSWARATPSFFTRSLHDESLEIPLLAPLGEQIEKGQRPLGIRCSEKAALA